MAGAMRGKGTTCAKAARLTGGTEYKHVRLFSQYEKQEAGSKPLKDIV